MEELRLHEERGPFVNMPGMTEEKFDSLRFKEREGNKYRSRSFRGSFGSKTKPISIRFTNIGIAKMTWPRLIHLIATHHSMQFLQPGMYYLLWHKRLVFLLLCCIPKNMPNFLRMSILVDFLHPYPFGTDINWGLKELFGDKMWATNISAWNRAAAATGNASPSGKPHIPTGQLATKELYKQPASMHPKKGLLSHRRNQEYRSWQL